MTDDPDIGHSEDSELKRVIGSYRGILEGVNHVVRNSLPNVVHDLEGLERRLKEDGMNGYSSDIASVLGRLRGLDQDVGALTDQGVLMYCGNGIRLERLLLYEDVIQPALDFHGLVDDMHAKQVSVDHSSSLERGMQVIGDREHLKRVYTILFLNAVKFAPERTHFSYGIEDIEGHYKLNVFNYAQEPLGDTDIFQDGKLKSVRRIVECHGGKIWTESDHDGGRPFVNVIFTLPKVDDIQD